MTKKLLIPISQVHEILSSLIYVMFVIYSYLIFKKFDLFRLVTIIGVIGYVLAASASFLLLLFLT